MGDSLMGIARRFSAPALIVASAMIICFLLLSTATVEGVVRARGDDAPLTPGRQIEPRGRATDLNGPVFYVSPSGNDANPGTAQSPFRSLEHARNVVRGRDRHMHSSITVELDSGVYRLRRQLIFGPQDSGTHGHDVVWTAAPGATPVISGARRITGWNLSGSSPNIWVAPMPRSLHARDIYVNGMRASAASGLLPVKLSKTSTGYVASSPIMSTWRNPTGIDFVYIGGTGRMTEPSCPVASIRGTSIRMAQPCWDNSNLRAPNWVGNTSLTPPAPTLIRNAYELLDAPGQSYIDNAHHLVYYIPRAGEDMRTADVEAPTLQRLVTGNGKPHAPVRNIIFSNIQFSFATWLQPNTPEGFSEIQAGYTLTGRHAYATEGLCRLADHGACPYGAWTKEPGAIQFSYDRAISFLNDRFVHLGAAGLNLDNGSQEDRVVGSVFTDISGNGIELGNVNIPEAKRAFQTRAVDITDNHLDSLGVEYPGAVAILAGYVADTVISHNQIDNIPYTAISIGWGGWPDKIGRPAVSNYSHDNVVSDNLIYDYMQVLDDGGAVYTQGITGTNLANGERVTGNVVHGQLDWSEAFKSDDAATFVTYSGNVSYDDTYDWGNYHLNTQGRGPRWDQQLVTGNYWQQGYPVLSQKGVIASGNTLITGPQQVPHMIIAAAGITASFQPILRWVPSGEAIPYPPEEPAALYFLGGKADVTWHPSTDAGDTPILSYTVTPCLWVSHDRSCPLQARKSVTLSAAQFNQSGYAVVPGLTGRRYSFEVVANNAAGSSTPSVFSLPIVAASAQPRLESAPTSPASISGHDAVRLSWYPPVSATCDLSDTLWCATPVLAYDIRLSTGRTYVETGLSQLIVSNHSGRTDVVIAGLTAGHAGKITVSAVNPAGAGPAATFLPG